VPIENLLNFIYFTKRATPLVGVVVQFIHFPLESNGPNEILRFQIRIP
jgi:hypothetical protein